MTNNISGSLGNAVIRYVRGSDLHAAIDAYLKDIGVSGVSEEIVKKAVEAYLQEHPAEVSEDTVKEIARQVIADNQDIKANTAARHQHSNQSVLDSITAARVAKWDANSGGSSGGSDDLQARVEALEASTAQMQNDIDNVRQSTVTKEYVDNALSELDGGEV